MLSGEDVSACAIFGVDDRAKLGDEGCRSHMRYEMAGIVDTIKTLTLIDLSNCPLETDSSGGITL